MATMISGKFGFTATIHNPAIYAGGCRIHGIVEARDRGEAAQKVCEKYSLPPGRVSLRDHRVVTHKQIIGAERGNVID